MHVSKVFPSLRDTLPRDLMASVVVFLVALPLCMGIAIASGMPPAKGLLTGIVGGLVVGFLAGSPLQVSGPAAGLAVLVFELVRTYGVAMLGPILLLAGAIQLLAGRLRLGCWFRVTSPAVVYGMLAGIGILIVLSQLHVMLTCWPWPIPPCCWRRWWWPSSPVRRPCSRRRRWIACTTARARTWIASCPPRGSATCSAACSARCR